MPENTHVAFDIDLCRTNPEAAADKIAELHAALKSSALPASSIQQEMTR